MNQSMMNEQNSIIQPLVARGWSQTDTPLVAMPRVVLRPNSASLAVPIHLLPDQIPKQST